MRIIVRFVVVAVMALFLSACSGSSPTAPTFPGAQPGVPPSPPTLIGTPIPVLQQFYVGVMTGLGGDSRGNPVIYWIGKGSADPVSFPVRLKVLLKASAPRVLTKVSFTFLKYSEGGWVDTCNADWCRHEHLGMPLDNNISGGVQGFTPDGPGLYKTSVVIETEGFAPLGHEVEIRVE